MASLPSKWTLSTLGEVCSKPQYGWTCKASKNGRLKILRTTDISKDKVDWNRVPYCTKEPNDIEKYKIKKNDILVSRAGSVGISYRVDEVPDDTVFASYLIRFKPFCEIQPKYLEYFLQSDTYWKAISEYSAGIAVPNVNASKLSTLLVPIAPAKEQQRIVAKLEKLMAKVDQCKARLEKTPSILKRFRQAVLASACSGELTKDWRELHPDIEPASIRNKILYMDRTKPLTASKKSRPRAYQLNKPENGLSELPPTWEWIALGNYVECLRGRFSVRPRNDPRYYNGKYPFIQIGDLPREGGNVLFHRQTLNEKGLLVSKLFPKGTVVIAIVGATIGNTGILSYDMCFPDSLVGMNTGTESGNIFLEYFLRNEKENIRAISYSSGGQPNIKLETLNPYPFPLPPIEEEREIVRRVESLFKIADQI